MRFDNCVVLITGGASGIGKAAVRKFHAEGASVVFADCNTALSKALVTKHVVEHAKQRHQFHGARGLHSDFATEVHLLEIIDITIRVREGMAA